MQTFGRWTVIGPTTGSGKRTERAACRCECGVERDVLLHNLRTGLSQSCGCLSHHPTHGHTTGRRGAGDPRSPTYNSWRGMVDRCHCPTSGGYSTYGARGIRVCDRWRKFADFLADMGERPSRAHSIEREDNDGNYEPGNCRWATRKEQARNRRSSRLVTVRGRTATVAEMAEAYGRKPNKVRDRLERGWEPERALMTP